MPLQQQLGNTICSLSDCLSHRLALLECLPLVHVSFSESVWQGGDHSSYTMWKPAANTQCLTESPPAETRSSLPKQAFFRFHIWGRNHSSKQRPPSPPTAVVWYLVWQVSVGLAKCLPKHFPQTTDPMLLPKHEVEGHHGGCPFLSETPVLDPRRHCLSLRRFVLVPPSENDVELLVCSCLQYVWHDIKYMSSLDFDNS